MKALLMHTSLFRSQIVEASTRPAQVADCRDSNEIGEIDEMQDCITVFFCVETGDCQTQIGELYEDIRTFSNDVKCNKIMIAPFVHLSQNPARPKPASALYKQLVTIAADNFDVKTSSFGFHKSLDLSVLGHPGSFRFFSYGSIADSSAKLSTPVNDEGTTFCERVFGITFGELVFIMSCVMIQASVPAFITFCSIHLVIPYIYKFGYIAFFILSCVTALGAFKASYFIWTKLLFRLIDSLPDRAMRNAFRYILSLK